jgi:subtilisin family serine protease
VLVKKLSLLKNLKGNKLVVSALVLFFLLSLTGGVLAVNISKPNPSSLLSRLKAEQPSFQKKFDRDYVEGEVLVKFVNSTIDLKKINPPKKSEKPTTSFKNFRNFKSSFPQLKEEEKIDEQENKVVSGLKKFNISKFQIDLKSGQTVEQVVGTLNSIEHKDTVAHAQPNYQYQPTATPNDTYFNKLWGLNNTGQTVNGTAGTSDADIDAPEAWGLEKSSWTNVTVAVIDTGVTLSHPDLVNNLAPGWDFVDGDDTPEDDNGHGTHVAGIIAGVANNSSGVSGLSYQSNLKVMPLRTDFTTAKNIAAIEFAASRGVKIISASWGCYEFDQGGSHAVCGDDYGYGDQAMIDAIEAFPGLFVTSAGNGDGDADPEGDNHEIENHDYPCDHTAANIICVAATDQNDDLTSFSDYGAVSVDVAAPGENIYSTYNQYTADPLFADPLFLEDFEDVIEPDIGDQFAPEGVDNNWGTAGGFIWTDLPNFPYAPGADTSIVSDPIDLTGKSAATLSFIAYCDTEPADPFWFDYVEVYARRTSTSSWVSLRRFDEDRLGLVLPPYGVEVISIPIIPYISSETQIKFNWVTDGFDDGGPYNGCALDNIRVEAAAKYAYLDGTSMATPYVSGLAGLLWSYKSSLTTAQVKAKILDTGDSLLDLSGKTVTGKRINVYQALKSLDTTKPTGSIKIKNGATYAYSKYATLNLKSSDSGFGVSSMQFSNNGSKWTSWKTFKTTYSNWNLTSSTYGGNGNRGTKYVYVRYKDKVGNISLKYKDSIIYIP